jgi:hypothetical protein
VNLYTFSLQNPLRYVDPDGLSPQSMFGNLRIPGARDRTGIDRTIGTINANSTSTSVRASQSLSFMMRSLGLSGAGLREGTSIEPDLQQRDEAIAVVRRDTKGNPVQVAFDQAWAAVSIEGGMAEVALGADPAWAENDRGNGTALGVLRGMRSAIEQAA